MNIIVCIKQVPDTTNIKINPETNTLIREGVECIINPFDTYAIEEGLRIKERLGGKVTVVSMGPPQAEDALKEAISLGADDAILLSDPAFAGSDTLATSYTLAKAIEKIGDYGLIICGKQAMDGDTAQVGPGISAHLNIPQVTYVKKIEEINSRPEGLHYEGDNVAQTFRSAKYARVERMIEEGYEVIETPLPCLFTVVKEINEPRLPSLRGKMRARSAKITLWTSKDLDLDPQRIGLEGSPTQVIKIFTPSPRGSGQMLTGTTSEITDQLVNLLKDEIK